MKFEIPHSFPVLCSRKTPNILVGASRETQEISFSVGGSRETPTISFSVGGSRETPTIRFFRLVGPEKPKKWVSRLVGPEKPKKWVFWLVPHDKLCLPKNSNNQFRGWWLFEFPGWCLPKNYAGTIEAMEEAPTGMGWPLRCSDLIHSSTYQHM